MSTLHPIQPSIPLADRRSPSPAAPAPSHASAGVEEVEMTPEEEAEELKFYLTQIYEIVKPVICCIILSVLWVKISQLDSDFRPQSPGYVVYAESSSDSTGARLWGSLQNALIFLATIVGATVVFVLLFKYGCHKVLYGYLLCTVVLILGFISNQLILNIVQVFSLPLDWISLVFSLFNFACTGMMVIFWRGPLWLQQAYLVVMSSLLAFVLNGFEAWTTWLLLVALALWDLVAVLCPFGPLKILIDSSREQRTDIPALLYSSTMAYESPSSPPSTSSSARVESGSTSADGLLADNKKSPVVEKPQERVAVEQVAVEDDIVDDEERSGLKLGLGDFIFYSVLISRTSLSDWVTTIACFVAVMMGLISTIFLLVIYRKALPALPISIAFGVLFYFLGAFMLRPFVVEMAFNGGVFI